MSELDDIKRRAGITEDDYGTDTEMSAANLARSWINGNRNDTFRAVKGNTALFASVAMILNNVGSNELIDFLQAAIRRG